MTPLRKEARNVFCNATKCLQFSSAQKKQWSTRTHYAKCTALQIRAFLQKKQHSSVVKNANGHFVSEVPEMVAIYNHTDNLVWWTVLPNCTVLCWYTVKQKQKGVSRLRCRRLSCRCYVAGEMPDPVCNLKPVRRKWEYSIHCILSSNISRLG